MLGDGGGDGLDGGAGDDEMRGGADRDDLFGKFGDDLVLDLDAVLARAFGPGDYGTQQVTPDGARQGFDADRITTFRGFPEPAGAAASTPGLATEPAGTTDAIP